MKKISKLSLVLAAALAFTSCGEKLALLREHFTVTPETLVVKGGKVDVSVEGVIPEKMFPAKGLVVITPVLKYEGGEVEGTPVYLQGEKATGNNKVISSKTGGSVSMTASFDYIPAMQRSELFARVQINDGKKDVEHPDVKIADGVASTETMGDIFKSKGSASTDKFQRIIQEKTEAQILYLIQQSSVRSSELKSEEVKALANAIAVAAKTENQEINGIEIASYASPDGATDLNDKLANQRGKNASSYINREVKKAKTTASVNQNNTAEDWEGFQELVNASNIQDKDLILRVLSMYSDADQREEEIKKLSAAYKTLADDILPKLRRSKIVLTVDLIGKSDEEIKNLSANDPSALNIEELLYAATLYETAAEKEDIYNKAISTYPDDYRAYNNIGLLRHAEKNEPAAKAMFEKAYTKEQAPEVCANLALCALHEGADVETIKAYLAKAESASGYDHAMGLLAIKEGNYKEAAKWLSDCNCNNSILANILAGDYTTAKAKIDNPKNPDAKTYYLQGILGARTNNKAEVVAGLKKAVSMDASLKEKAAKDIEFAKFATDEEVAAILK